MSKYTPCIGLEIHVQLKTKSKMFSSAPNNPNTSTPNINIDEVVTAQPGTLPVANKEAIRLGVMVGLALNCQIDEYSKFDRKHYFYPDLPKGYQISQYDEPIARDGYLDIVVSGESRRVRIKRAHLEEDAGKNMHPEGVGFSLVDYNRAGSALLEIVTEPDITSAEEARIFLQELRSIVRYVGASDADMEKGSMRCEPNISLRGEGQTGLPNYKVEVKNINSFKFAEAAILYEIKRQSELLDQGITPKQVTMGWDEKNNKTIEQRSKEDAQDYRYFPDPDLPILHFPEKLVNEWRSQLPELPSAKRRRFAEEYGLTSTDIETLISWKELTFFFEAVASELGAWVTTEKSTGKELSLKNLVKRAANWCTQEVSASLNSKNINPEDSTVTPENLAELITLIDEGKISGSAAKQVFKVMFEKGGEPLSIVSDLGLEKITDISGTTTTVIQVISDYPDVANQVRTGTSKARGFLFGETMKRMGGKGDPQLIGQILDEELNK